MGPVHSSLNYLQYSDSTSGHYFVQIPIPPYVLSVFPNIYLAITSLARSFASRSRPIMLLKNQYQGNVHLFYIFGHVPSCLRPVSFVQHHTPLFTRKPFVFTDKYLTKLCSILTSVIPQTFKGYSPPSSLEEKPFYLFHLLYWNNK